MGKIHYHGTTAMEQIKIKNKKNKWVCWAFHHLKGNDIMSKDNQKFFFKVFYMEKYSAKIACILSAIYLIFVIFIWHEVSYQLLFLEVHGHNQQYQYYYQQHHPTPFYLNHCFAFSRGVPPRYHAAIPTGHCLYMAHNSTCIHLCSCLMRHIYCCCITLIHWFHSSLLLCKEKKNIYIYIFFNKLYIRNLHNQNQN